MPEQEDTGVTLRQWTRAEFHQAADLGWFNNEKVELIHGKVYKKLTTHPPHALGICASAETFAAIFGPGCYIRQQLPVILATDGEPLSDIVVVRGSWRDYPQHPTQDDVLLLVEVSDSTLYIDRNEKAALYAEASLADYWMLNLNNWTLEVRRDPAPLSDAMYKFGYQSITIHTESDSVTPLALPQTLIQVADLLPPLPRQEVGR